MTTATRRKARIFYFAPISTDSVNARYGARLHVGAATNKVLGVCRAIRAGGQTPVIVSALLSSPFRDARHNAEITRSDGVCFAKIFSSRRGAVKRLVSSLSLLFFAISKVRPRDRILLYNFFPEFILLALYQRLVGNPAILDIEDSPRFDQEGFWNIIHRTSFYLLLSLCRHRYVIVSHHLGLQLRLTNFHPVYGVSSYFLDASSEREAFADGVVNVLYGGAILPATGKDLFLNAVRLLAQSSPDLPLHFHVTGLFPEAEFAALAREINGRGRIQVTVHADLSTAEYRKIAREMDIGLCLKLPSSGMGQTTFPSKVLEIAALGMLLCSTTVSDVPLIFDQKSAILLETETPEELADSLRDAVLDRAGSAHKAAKGRQTVLENYSEAAVGRNLVRFIYG